MFEEYFYFIPLSVLRISSISCSSRPSHIRQEKLPLLYLHRLSVATKYYGKKTSIKFKDNLTDTGKREPEKKNSSNCNVNTEQI